MPNTVFIALSEFLVSDVLFSVNLDDRAKLSRVINKVARIDRLPPDNSFEAMQIVQRAWELVDIYMHVARRCRKELGSRARAHKREAQDRIFSIVPRDPSGSPSDRKVGNLFPACDWILKSVLPPSDFSHEFCAPVLPLSASQSHIYALWTDNPLWRYSADSPRQ